MSTAVGIATWACAAAFFLAVMAYFFRKNALSGAVNIAFLGFICLGRPAMFALGLDEPFPPRFLVEYQELMVYVLLLFMVWIACFAISYTVLRPLGSVTAHLFPAAPPQLSRSWMMIVSICVTLAAVTGTLVLVAQFGSVARFVYAVKIGKELAGSYAVREVSVVGAIFCLVGLLHEISYRGAAAGRGRRYLNAVVLTYVTLISLNLTANYLWGNRANIGFFLVAAAFSFNLFVRPLKYWEIGLGIALLGLGLRGLAEIRADATAEVAGIKSYLDSMPIWTQVATTLHLVEFDALMLAIRDLGSNFELRGGEDFLNGLVSWIPRQFWPDKPDTYMVGGWFRRLYQPETTNGWPIMVIGSWMVNFGFVGVVLGGLVSGVISLAIDQRYAPTFQSNAFSAAMPAALGLFFLGGGYDTGTPQAYVLLIIPLFLFAALIRAVSRRSGGTANTGAVARTKPSPHVGGRPEVT